MNREINHLLRDVELPLGVDDLAREPFSREEIHRVFDALEFRTLRDRLLALAPTQEETAGGGFDLSVGTVVAGGLGEWFAARRGRLLGVDVQGNVSPGSGDAWGMAIADDAGAAVTLDLADIAPADEAALAAWLADPASKKALHEAKTDWHCLDGRGFRLEGIAFDTALAAYLCHPDQRSYALADLSIRYLRRELRADEEASGQGMLALDGEEEGQRSALRATAVRELADALGADLEQRHATALLDDVELPLLRVLAQMEKDGIAADADYFAGLERQFGAAVEDAASNAYSVIGREVNLSSPKQLQEVLFDQLGMPKTKRIKTGYTTDAEALTDLYERTAHPFLQYLLAHRDAIRLRQTVEGLIRSVAPDGRIHTTFQQTIAATGRLSSTDPNLQNIPIRTEEGHRIRRGFVVGPGYETLLTADYSQIEMRIMAHLSGDAGLIEAFRSGEDLHSFVGSRVFGVPTSEVTGAMRSKIKAMSYGLAYGLSAFGLSRQLKIDTAEARSLMDEYFERFGGVRDYLSGVVEEARRVGLHGVDPRTTALPPRPHERQPPAPRDGRADGVERPDPGERGGSHQGRDDRGAAGPGRRGPALADGAPGARRTRARGGARGTGAGRVARPRADGLRGRPVRPARGHRGHGERLAHRGALTWLARRPRARAVTRRPRAPRRR